MKLWKERERIGTRFWFRKLEWFACEGLILLFDHETGKPFSIKPDDFELRAKAIHRGTQRFKTSYSVEWQRDLFWEQTRGANDMLAAVREARAMGDPSDANVQAYALKHRASLRGLQAGYGGVSGHVSPSIDPFDHKEIPMLINTETGEMVPIRHDVAHAGDDGRPMVTPSRTVPTAYQPARRKRRLLLPGNVG